MRKASLSYLNLLFVFFFTKILFSVSLGDELKGKINECSIDEIDKLPENSYIIIGHAYGSPSNKNYFLAPNVINFIKENKKKINTIIFSGDIILIPNKYKWEKLYNFLGDDIEVYIAPGNHDIGCKTCKLAPHWYLKRIFYTSNLSKGIYPQRINLEGNNIILEDSVSSDWQMNQDVINLYKNLELSSNKIIVRHNIPVQELLVYANSRAGLKGKLPSFDQLSRKFDDQITIIVGDTGAFQRLPRIGCWEYKNLKVIINGIGEVEGDSILLIHQDKIFKYTLN